MRPIEQEQSAPYSKLTINAFFADQMSKSSKSMARDLHHTANPEMESLI